MAATIGRTRSEAGYYSADTGSGSAGVTACTLRGLLLFAAGGDQCHFHLWLELRRNTNGTSNVPRWRNGSESWIARRFTEMCSNSSKALATS